MRFLVCLIDEFPGLISTAVFDTTVASYTINQGGLLNVFAAIQNCDFGNEWARVSAGEKDFI